MRLADIKKLRQETGAGVMDAKRALEEAGGDMAKARKIIADKGLAKAAKKSERATGEGIILAYVHYNHQSGALVELACETDFVARTDDFKILAKELAMQVTSMDPLDVANFLSQPYIRDPQKTVKDLLGEYVGKLGENIKLVRFVRYGLGEAQ
jgi:elongation factor Ts